MNHPTRLMFYFAILVLAARPASARQVEWPRTRAELSDYAETSSYEDVIQFLQALQIRGSNISVRYIGESDGGKRLPLVVFANPPVATALEAKRAGKPIVYLQANIHAGEVEGKEAVLALLRDWSAKAPVISNRLILLVAPIYNIDGNEKWGDNRTNRPSQNGPERIGLRTNGKGLDLNRDCIKAESPEMRAALEHIYTQWDPDVVMDLHTTNGTRHGYQLTYSPPLNPNTEPHILAYTRDQLLPSVRKALAKKGIKLQDYGNVEGRGTDRAWRTFGDEPRYVTNYVGMRNRIAVLSEAASFLPFKTRIDSTRAFVDAILNEIAANPSRVLHLTRDADAQVTSEGTKPDVKLGVRFEMESRGAEAISLEKVEPGATVNHMTAPLVFYEDRMPVFDRFKTIATAKLPAAYLVPASETHVVELLRRHGIIVEKIGSWKGSVEEFEVTQAPASPGTFQGHRLLRLEGKFSPAQIDTGGQAYLVSTAQPLARLAFMMLEPESLDGVAAWGLLTEPVRAGSVYPIRKLLKPINAIRERIR